MSTSPRVPSYCIHTRRNLAYVRLDGRMIYLGKPDSPESRSKYDRIILEWLAAGRAPAPRSSEQGLSVNEVLLAYRRHAETEYRLPDGTCSAELERVNLALRPVMDLYGLTPARDFGPKSLKAVREHLIAKGRCRLTINQRIGCIKRAFAWAVSEELVPPHVFHGLQAVKGLRRGRSGAKEGKTVRPVPRQVVDAVVKHLPPTLQAMVRLHELTGMRSGELCLMRPCDIEMPNAGKPWVYRPSRHKTQHHGHVRAVHLGPQAQAILRPLLRPDLGAYIFSPARAQAERNAGKRAARKSRVQPSQRNRKKRSPERQPGARYTPASYRRALDYATRRAIRCGDLPEGTSWHPHQLRHNCATRVRQEFGLDAARAVLGHSTVVQSAEYAELDAELAAKAVSRLG